MMSSSWMGSHFTNDDLVKQSRMVEDYDFSISFEGIRDEMDIVEITCIPKKNAVVVWGKVEVIVYREDFIPLRLIYYDEDLNLSRKLEFSNIQIFDNKKIPLQMQMIPEDEPVADQPLHIRPALVSFAVPELTHVIDRKSTRLNSSH